MIQLPHLAPYINIARERTRTGDTQCDLYVYNNSYYELSMTDFSVIPITYTYVEQIFSKWHYRWMLMQQEGGLCYHKWEQRPSFTEVYEICVKCDKIKGQPNDV